jgi:hypothetical protein
MSQKIGKATNKVLRILYKMDNFLLVCGNKILWF